MIYLYGLLEPGARAETADLTGVTGPVVFTDLGPAVLAHGAPAAPDILPKRRHLLAHARVLETLAWSGTVLPMRFGMTCSLDEVAATVAAEAQAIATQFARLRGHVEYGIRIRLSREEALAAALVEIPALAAERDRLLSYRPGHPAVADFGRRLAELLDRRRATAQRALLARLAPLLADHVLRVPDSDVEVLAIDALVPETAVAGLAEALDAAARAIDFAPGAEPEIRLVGPGPAYSFVRLTLGTAGREAA